jgi:hypothetical protein
MFCDSHIIATKKNQQHTYNNCISWQKLYSVNKFKIKRTYVDGFSIISCCLECPGICKEVLEFLCEYFLKLFLIQKRTFCWIDFAWNSVWNSLKLRFGQFNVTLYFLTPFQYSCCAWICWYMVLDVLEKSLTVSWLALKTLLVKENIVNVCRIYTCANRH